jgi:DNA-binding transcriptional LysR family regulator
MRARHHNDGLLSSPPMALRLIAMGPDLRQMRYVVAVAQERNFTRAAERLHVAQQALSQQVRAVEEMLWVQLFDRAARPVKLTAAGEVFVQEAKRAISVSQRVLERTSAAARGELGTIRLAYTFSVAYETLPVLLEAFAADTPQVKVTTREMFGADIPVYLREDKIDLAITPHVDPGDDLGRERSGANRSWSPCPSATPWRQLPRSTSLRCATNRSKCGRPTYRLGSTRQ